MLSTMTRVCGAVLLLAVLAVAPTTPAGQPDAVAGMIRLGEAPSSATIRIDAGATFGGFTDAQVQLAKGGTLSVVNFDGARHTVTSDDRDADGNPLFTAAVEPGASATVDGVADLAPGTYPFYCIFHAATMRGTLTITGEGGGVTPAPQSFDQPLVQPRTLTKSRLRIPITRADVRVMPTGPLTRMWTYGGSYPGPTIVRPAGEATRVTFVNRLPGRDRLSVHLHGDHHPYQFDGQPDRFLIGRGASRTYRYPLADAGRPLPAAFLWYHDHRMASTTRNNWMGLQGMFLVTDRWAKRLDLPTGQYDVPLMVTERSLDSNNQLVPVMPHMTPMTGPAAPPNDATIGDRILVNGRFAPYLDVATHRYRLRLLNSSPFTTYNFTLSNGLPFIQVATGNGLLPKAVVRQNLVLGPAQRAEVVVDFRGQLGKDVVLQSVPLEDAPNGAGAPVAQIMQFRVRTAVTDGGILPTNLRPPRAMKRPSRVSAVWSVGLGSTRGGSFWTLNGKPFDPRRVVLKVDKGSTQMWELRNDSKVTHFMHLHQQLWRTVSRNGKRPPPWERGLEDTWRVDPGERVRVMARFTDFTGVFMIHCHMLDHEDDGLMAQFAVVDPQTQRLPKGYTYDPRGGPAARAKRLS